MAFVFIVFGLMVIVLIVTTIANSKKNAATIETKIAEAEKDGFLVDKKVVCGDFVLIVDNKNKEWSVLHPRDRVFKKYAYTDIIDFEIFEDGNSIAKGRAGSALIGGFLFGATGAIIGSSGSRATINVCNSLQVIIRVNDLQFPQLTIPLINSATKKGSFVYTTMMQVAKSMAATLAFIQNDGKEILLNDDAPSPATNALGPMASAVDELRAAKMLLDDGIITREEFEAKKIQLLDI